MVLADFGSFIREPELSIVPLEIWQWILLAFLLLSVLAVFGVGGSFADGYRGQLNTPIALLEGFFLLFLLTPMYRAVPPGLGWQWWLLTGSLIAALVLTALAISRYLNLQPSLVYLLWAPASATILAVFYDLFSERLASIPMSWGTVTVIGIALIAYLASDK